LAIENASGLVDDLHLIPSPERPAALNPADADQPLALGGHPRMMPELL
jgi:hypothetical protein